MGNICRSPAAEYFMRAALEEQGSADLFNIDSEGTGGWPAGNKPDRRMQSVAKKAGLAIDGSARQVCSKDFSRFDWVFCMDNKNYADCIEMGADPNRTHVFLKFIEHPSISEVPDPYYGGSRGFDNVISLLNNAILELTKRSTPKFS